MHYLIFLPNKAANNRQHLVEAGLGDLLREGDDTPASSDLMGPGPGDLPGQIWTWGNGLAAYLPDRQTWTPDKLGRYWLGIETAKPPTPEDLLRKNHVGGLVQRLADGHEWILPNVLRLPTVFEEDSNGELLRVPHSRYSNFVDEAGWALMTCLDVLTGVSAPDWKRAVEFVSMALSINYRVNRSIIVKLGLLNDDLLHTCMAKCTDTDRIYQLQQDLAKKKLDSTGTG